MVQIYPYRRQILRRELATVFRYKRYQIDRRRHPGEVWWRGYMSASMLSHKRTEVDYAAQRAA